MIIVFVTQSYCRHIKVPGSSELRSLHISQTFFGRVMCNYGITSKKGEKIFLCCNYFIFNVRAFLGSLENGEETYYTSTRKKKNASQALEEGVSKLALKFAITARLTSNGTAKETLTFYEKRQKIRGNCVLASEFG